MTYDPASHTLTVDGQAVKLSADVDLSNYYTKSEIDNKLVNLNTNQPVDLTGYVKKEDLADYARKTDIPSVPKIVLDTQKRQLTIDGQEIDIPTAVDLSQYAKKDDVPKIALDVSARTITIGDASINVPKSVDLSGYLTVNDADAKYANKSDVKDVSIDVANREIKIGNDTITVPESVDLSQYAKTGDVPNVDLNTFTRTLTVNGQSVSIPASVDLSGYATKSDLSAYITVADADAKYANKSETGNTQHVFKTAVNLADFAKSGETVYSINIHPIFNGYFGSDVKQNDIILDAAGNVYKVGKVDNASFKLSDSDLLLSAGVHASDLTLSKFDKKHTQTMSIVAKETMKSFLGMNDTDKYTLDIDECTLTDETTKTTTKLVPAVYPLRDLNLNNLTIKSKTNYGLDSDPMTNAVQLIVTPYFAIANVVITTGQGTTESMFWHPIWVYDNGSWFGITEEWHKLS